MLPRSSIVFAALTMASPAFAQQPILDSEPSGPCLWRVVVKTEPHPLLTASFRAKVARDLVAALQPSIGPLGTVEVIDLDDALAGKADALVQDFAAKGFAALDAPRDLTGVKTHFLRIAVRGGQYHLETRQHDGFTGLASPAVRKQSTRAPELVGRMAGLMIDREFGLAGTLDPAAPNAVEATVRFRGSKLGPVDRFVKVGDVFAVSRITRAANRPAPPPARTATGKVIAPPPGSEPPAALTPAVHPFTYLKVLSVAADGSASCAVIRSPKYTATLPNGPLGYRCMKLSTVQARIAVKLVSGSDGTAAAAPIANVRATESGFSGKDDPKDYLDFRDGLYRSPRPLSNLACITVSLGKTKAERFPVPVLGSEPITLRFELNPEAEARAVYERSAIALMTRASDARTAQNAAFEAVGKLIKAKKNKEALARAKGSFEAADSTDKALVEEMEELKKQDIKVPGAAAVFAAIERQLKSLRQNNEALASSVKQLQAAVDKEGDPTTNVASEVQAGSLNTRISLLLASGEIEEALAALDQLATLVPDNAGVKARKEKLEQEWKPKSPEHAKAREYLLKSWPKLATIGDLKDSLPQLATNVEICKKAGDHHAFRAFLAILDRFPSKLQELLTNNDLDMKALNEIKVLREVVPKIQQGVLEYLKKE